jgi:hypothetical protein
MRAVRRSACAAHGLRHGTPGEPGWECADISRRSLKKCVSVGRLLDEET